MVEEKAAIFLYDSIIPWKSPPKEIGGYEIIDINEHPTKLIEQIGLDTLDETIGHFRIIGSAVKYLADVSHLGSTGFDIGGAFNGEEKREILFHGSLAIYKEGEILNTGIQGYEQVRHGKIWIARQVKEPWITEDGLRSLVLGDDSSGSEERIESILEGYRVQEK
jgi:hypothetical protein